MHLCGICSKISSYIDSSKGTILNCVHNHLARCMSEEQVSILGTGKEYAAAYECMCSLHNSGNHCFRIFASNCFPSRTRCRRNNSDLGNMLWLLILIGMFYFVCKGRFLFSVNFNSISLQYKTETMSTILLMTSFKMLFGLLRVFYVINVFKFNIQCFCPTVKILSP